MEQQQYKSSSLSLFGNTPQERVNNAITHLQNGKGILLVDDEDRENEGDLIFSAASMTTKDMALMIRACSGIVCLCITQAKANSLHLPAMVVENTSKYQTPFTVSIDAKEGITTGVSAQDRITTIQALCNEHAKAADLVKPGHMFPLIARENGVLERNGHTDGSVDLMRLAKLAPEAVLCELMNEDGTMARLPEVILFAQKQGLVVLSIEDIIYYRKYVADYK
ncbi:MAG: 3,4-dihydroxy-2-butanone-4-phosphate synthase [Bacteroidota bacterium]